jgi:hypothetical protein
LMPTKSSPSWCEDEHLLHISHSDLAAFLHAPTSYLR